MNIYINKATNGQYFFNIKAANGQILCSSETYATKQGCIDSANLIKNAKEFNIYKGNNYNDNDR